MPPPRTTLIGLPYDASSSFLRGAAAAPPLIRAELASPGRSLWSESLLDLGLEGRLWDAGDLLLPADDRTHGLVQERLRQMVADGALPLVLGGDHSLTWPVLRAVGPAHPGLTILQFDAHPDLYDTFGGIRHSHACPFARIMEEGLAARLVQVGIRATNAHERAQAERFGVEVIDMQAWTSGARPDVRGAVYVSVDMDAFDPAHAPGVAHRESGGLTPRDVLGVIQSLEGPLVGADVVEYNPLQDNAGITAVLCAKLVKELAARMIETAPAD